MGKRLAIFESEWCLSKKEVKKLRKRAEKRLGKKFNVLVLNKGLHCAVFQNQSETMN